jgi:hypothetical protein
MVRVNLAITGERLEGESPMSEANKVDGVVMCDDRTICLNVTMTFKCENMIDEKTFKEEFNSDPYAFFKSISDGESILNFADEPEAEKITVSYT